MRDYVALDDFSQEEEEEEEEEGVDIFGEVVGFEDLEAMVVNSCGCGCGKGSGCGQGA